MWIINFASSTIFCNLGNFTTYITKDFKSQITITRWLGIIASFYFNAIYSQLTWVWNIGYQNLRKIIEIFPLTNHKVFGSFSKPLFWYALNYWHFFPQTWTFWLVCECGFFLNNHFIVSWIYIFALITFSLTYVIFVFW